jgi:hypothetical protein
MKVIIPVPFIHNVQIKRRVLSDLKYRDGPTSIIATFKPSKSTELWPKTVAEIGSQYMNTKLAEAGHGAMGSIPHRGPF